MFYPRFLRKRWVLAVIFICSLVYFLCATFSKSSEYILTEYESKRTLRQPFEWQPSDETNDTVTVKKCRNSKQGPDLIVDHKGYVCRTEHVGPQSCCDTKRTTTKQYSCHTCQANGCCGVYEHCVSCCLLPKNQHTLKKVLGENLDVPHNLFLSQVNNVFELCLAKCRTSSLSVQHENSYRDSKIRFCYGDKSPDIQVIIN